MFKYTYLTFWLLLVIPVYAGSHSMNARSNERSVPGGGYYSRRNYYQDNYPGPTQPQPQTPKEYLDKNSGYSTFGIIAIIFVVIMAGLLFYYAIICYPLLCRDEKKYRFMDVSSTITAQSRSMQSIENFPVDSKLEK